MSLNPNTTPRIAASQTAVTTPQTVNGPDLNDLFEPLEIEFVKWAQSPIHTNKQRLTHEQRREYKSFLNNPDQKPRNQREHNMRHRARTNFILIDGQLFRKAGDELDDPDKAAASTDRRVIMVEAAYTIIRRCHELVGLYAGVNKTWAEIQREFYDITKAKVAWVIRNCKTSAANVSSNVKALIQMIKSSVPNEQWCIDLVDFQDRPYGGYTWLYHSKVCYL